jgi:hypothetical protein
MNNTLLQIIRAKVKSNGSCVISLNGRCMEPFLMSGDKARIVYSNQINIGDVVLIELQNGGGALHRVVEANGDIFRTKGDYSGKSELISSNNIIGVAVEYFLDDEGWAKDCRTNEEILKLVDLSTQIGFKQSRTDSYEIRKTIWEINMAARRVMKDKVSVNYG